MKTPVNWFCTLLLLGLSSGAQAAPVYFFSAMTDRVPFQIAAGGSLLLESFEDPFADGTVQQFTAGGAADITVTSDGNLNRWTSLPSRLISDGNASLAFPEGDTSIVSFSFATPISAFGIDVLDLNFTDMSFADDLGNSLSNVLLKDDCGPAGGPSCTNRQFFGVVNDQAFSEVVLTFLNPDATGGTVSFDRLEIAPVPVPAAVWLFGTALVGLAGFGRRKKSA